MLKLIKLLLPLLVVSSSISPVFAVTASPKTVVVGETLSVGGNHTCGLTSAGDVRCWGRNADGQATVPSDLGVVSQVSAGAVHTCVLSGASALSSAGTVRCWGSNSGGQTTVPSELGSVNQVSAGSNHTCAVTTAGAVRCWGDRSNGRTTVPSDLGVVAQVSAGGAHTCALSVAGAVRCWGDNSQGQATSWPGLGLITKVSAGLEHPCALNAAGTVRCWGNASGGRTAVPSDLGVVTQVSAGSLGTCVLTAAGTVRCSGSDWGQIPLPANLGAVTQVNAGYAHTCVLTAAGAVRCWGSTSEGATTVPSVASAATQVNAGYSYTCGLNAAQIVRCWGLNDNGQTTVPSGLGLVTQVSTGYDHTCVLNSVGTVRCWGKDKLGSTTVPTGLGRVTEVSTGGSHTCALNSAGTVRCWGLNSDGRSSVPSGLGLVTQVSAGFFHTCALNSSGVVNCWGLSTDGRTTVPANLGVVTQISLSANHTCALNSSGAVRCWGSSSRGATAVPSDLGVVTQLSTGYEHTCALNSAGTVRCWGSNSDGRTSVPSDLGVVTRVSAGGSHTCALTATGTIRCWGLSTNGRTNVPASLYESDSFIAFKRPMTQFVGALTGEITGNLIFGSEAVAEFNLDKTGNLYYQWLRDGVEIAGATAKSYQITDQDLGTSLSATLSFTNGQMISYGVTAQRLVEFPLVTSSSPTISGAKNIGSTLTAALPGWEEEVSFAYEWLRNGEVISGANTATYFASLIDLGANLTVRVTGTKDRHRPVTQTSADYKISSSIPKSPCPGSLDTSEPWLGTISQPRSGNWVYPPVAGWSLKGQNGRWPTGTKFCVFWVTNGHQIVPGANSANYQSKFVDGGKSIQYVVVGTDKQGNRALRFSTPVTFERCEGSLVTVKPVNTVNGATSRISGSVKTCSTAKTVQYREKPYGKSWGTWKDYPATTQGKFSITRTFKSNSKYQVRVDNAGTWLSSGEQAVNVRIKFALPLAFSWKSARNPQGFNQGGNVTIKFTGDREFNGTCTVLSETDYAFNFAGVGVGSESRFTQFKVRNGYGTGQVTMRWNGRATVGALCEDPKFTDIYDFRYATFKLSF